MIEATSQKQRVLWFFVLLGGALAWLIHLLVTYTIGEFACISDGSWFRWAGLSSANWLIYFASLLCLSVSIGSLFISLRMNTTKDSFLPRFGIFVNLIFSLAIVAQTIPNIVFSGDC